MDEQLLLSVPQMARRLSIGVTQAWAIVARGEVPVVKIGRSTRVFKSAVDEWAIARADKTRGTPDHVKAVPEVKTGTAKEVGRGAARRSG